MIKYLGIRNFKCLKRAHLKPAALNLCFGMNGMGKSSLLQAMLLLRQSQQKGVLANKGLLVGGGDLVSIGAGRDVFYQYAGKNDLLEFEIHTAEGRAYAWSFSFDAGSDILPLAEHSGEDGGDVPNLEKLALFNERFSYLSADRLGPRRVYSKSVYEISRNRSIGMRGEYAVHYLSQFGMRERVDFKRLQHPGAQSDRLYHQVAAWLGDICPGTRLVIEDIKGADLLKLAFQFETKGGYTNEFSPLNVGFGLVYALPVVVALLRAQPGDLLLLENPESHLHPKGQSSIGRLLAAAGAHGVQIFCESHSDHIINGVRVAVKEGLIHRDDLSIYYFSRNVHGEEHCSEITEIGVDRQGELSCYPEGLLDEWSNLLVRLI